MMSRIFKYLCLFISISVKINAFSQNVCRVIVKGNIVGLTSGTPIYLSINNRDRVKAIAFSSKFKFERVIENAGEIGYLSIDSVSQRVKLILDCDSVLMISGSIKDWPTCITTGSKAQDDFEDFEERVQAPFSKSYRNYLNVMREITGKKEVNEWREALSNFKGVDSLRVNLAEQIYQNAVFRYYKETFIWICLHHDCLYTPFLILKWWPQADYRYAFSNLTIKAQNSFYGRILEKASQ